ncbi:MAG TPA: ABC transporter permease [Opitutaceae bacterium]|nr:ABC transporter permease [Opitutaceae bacterium]
MLADLRYALRQLLKAPAFTSVAVVTLALGIGACAAIFSVVDAVLLRPLAYPDAGRLAVIKEGQPPTLPEFAVSPPDFLDWERQATAFASMAAITSSPLNLTGEGEPQRLIGLRATGHYFEVFGVQPVLGRAFGPAEDAPGKNQVVVLSYACWQRVFGGAAGVVGRSLPLNGSPYTVIGIAPAGFGQANHVDAWVPMAFSASDTGNDSRDDHYIQVAGRLRPGATFAQADAEMRVIAARLAQQYPATNKGWIAFVVPMLDNYVRNVRAVLWLLSGAVACVLLIACANIANLLLARAGARQREMSIRTALGASRGRLMRQLLTESVLLGLAGGAAGVLLARWGLDALLALAPNLPRVAEVHLDGSVLAFAVALSIGTGLVFGFAPAWFAGRVGVNEALKQGGRGTTDASTRAWVRSGLVVIEVAAAVVLLAGAGLLARSFAALTHVDPGFTPDNAVVLRLTLPQKKYDTPERLRAFTDALLARLQTLPGVESAGLTQSMPLLSDWVAGFTIDGRPAVDPQDMPNTNYYAVTPGYFHAMGLRLVRGRLFAASDDARAPRVALINETLARQQFPHEDPLGKRINLTVGPDAWREIVGVVADVTQYGVDQVTPCQAYEPFDQLPRNMLNVVVRTRGPVAPVLGALRPAVYAVDKDQPVGSITPLGSILADSLVRQRFGATLLTVFSLAALVIAGVGIYGVMACVVTQRTAEFGIRLALGAQPRDVLRMVLGQGARLVGLGLFLGAAGTFLTARAIRALLYHTGAHDPWALGAATLLLAGAAAVACWLPARRATKVDPIIAMRSE